MNNRICKFRAWDRNKKKMTHAMSLADFAYEGFREPYTDEFGEATLPETYDVMQYTGLKDKNGKEIYEGDILSYFPDYYEANGTKAEVFQFYWGETESMGREIYGWVFNREAEDCEVIGNCWENPELLTQSK